jgi:hypothetical protein
MEYTFSKELTERLGMLFGYSEPRYRYYPRAGSKDRYFYTCEKINHKGKSKYVAGIYRYIKSRDLFKLVRKSGFAKKKRAKETARDWCARKL